MVAVFSACSHSGLVSECQRLFDNMSKSYGIKPKMEHYSCLVDLYARAGLLEEAEEILHRMPFRPSAAIWAALLNACSVHRNTEIGERAAKELLEMKTQNAGHYVLIANMYAAAGRWQELAKVRMMMRDRGVRKAPGVAWVDIGKGFRPFSVGDRSSPLSSEIYTALEGLVEQMTDVGYVENELGLEEEFRRVSQIFEFSQLGAVE
nr:pentatricopeptide repeat protein AaPPR1305 [Agave angustifolia]